MNIYQYSSYREIFRELMMEKKINYGREFSYEKMAIACKVQRSYLSSVIGSETGHLNSDQVFEAAHFLKLDDEECKYVSVLHEFERSTSKNRKLQLQKEVDALRARGLATELIVAAPKMITDEISALTEFYLDVNAILIHMFLTVKRFQNDLPSIRRALCLDLQAFSAALQTIERAGLIRIHGKTIEVLKDVFHLPASSPLYKTYRIAMRLAAIQHTQMRPSANNYSFSVLYSADEESRHKIQSRFLEFVDWAQQFTQAGKPTQVYQMNFDLLCWSHE